MDELKLFEVDCTWTGKGTSVVYAKNRNGAIDAALDEAPLPEDWDYVDNSFKVKDVKCIN